MRWQRVETLLPEGVDWTSVGQLMNRLRFGEIPPADNEISLLCNAYRLLALHARKRLGILGWFLV